MVGRARPLLDTKKVSSKLVIRRAVIPDDVRLRGWEQHTTNAGNNWNKDLAEDRLKKYCSVFMGALCYVSRRSLKCNVMLHSVPDLGEKFFVSN